MRLTTEMYQRIVAAKLFIDDNFHRSLDLESVSRHAFLSPFHFHRIFRQVYRHTPHQYITRKRIEKAKYLLANNKPVSEVCNEVGFESAGSFSTLFKNEIGAAPGNFGKIARLKKAESRSNPAKFIPACLLRRFS